ncbi:MAG: hypothetical protein ACUVRO_01180 [Armatimonadota bacterium]
MRTLFLVLMAVAVAVSPTVGAVKASKRKAARITKSAVRAAEEAAWSPKKPAAKPTGPAKKAAKPSGPKPTVKFAQTEKPQKPAPPPTREAASAVSGQKPPELPFGDLGAEGEDTRWLAELDGVSARIVRKLDALYNKKPTPKEELPKGVSGAKSYQSRLDKALTDPKLSDEDKQALQELKHERDSALYMLGCVYLTRNKTQLAAEALKLAATSQGKGTPIYDAASVELANLGKPL